MATRLRILGPRGGMVKHFHGALADDSVTLASLRDWCPDLDTDPTIMKCPYCREDNDKVIDTNAIEGGAIVRRRRECLACQRRFTTYERIEQHPLKVVKKDGRRVPFDRNRIRVGLEKACEKRDVSAQDIDRLVSDIENDIYQNMEREVPSEYIGELVMKKLRQLDPVAYVRFASVYREFKDASDFVEEVEPLLGKPSDSV